MGNGPIELAVSISRFVFPTIHVKWRPNMVILAPVEDCASALAAAPLVHHPHNGPVLLTPLRQLHPLVAGEIARLQPTGRGTEHGKPLRAQVFVVGPFDPGVAQAVERMGYRVLQISAASPAELAAKSLDFRLNLNRQIGKRTRDVLIGNAEDCRDIVPGAGFSAHSGIPILFTSKSEVPVATREALTALGNPDIHIIATTGTVTEDVQSSLENLTTGRVIRIGGKDAIEVAVNLARYMSPEGKVGWGRVQQDGHAFSFAPSHTWPPAILIGLVSHLAKHAPVLLLPPDGSVPEVLRDYLVSVNPPLTKPPGPPFMHGIVVGGTELVSWVQQVTVDTLLTKETGDEIPSEPAG